MQYVQHIQHIQHRYIDTLIHWYIIRDRDGSRLYGLNHWTKLFVTPRCVWYLKMGYTGIPIKWRCFFWATHTIGFVAWLWLAMACHGYPACCAGLRIGSWRLSSSRAAIFGLGALWGPVSPVSPVSLVTGSRPGHSRWMCWWCTFFCPGWYSAGKGL